MMLTHPKVDHSYPPEKIGRWCEANGVPFIDARPAKLYWPRDMHCTPAGYRVIAETLFNALAQSGLAP